MKQQSVNHGTLIKWNKGFTNSNSVDEDPTDMLEAALARQGMKVCFTSIAYVPSTMSVYCLDDVHFLAQGVGLVEEQHAVKAAQHDIPRFSWCSAVLCCAVMDDVT